MVWFRHSVRVFKWVTLLMTLLLMAALLIVSNAPAPQYVERKGLQPVAWTELDERLAGAERAAKSTSKSLSVEERLLQDYRNDKEVARLFAMDDLAEETSTHRKQTPPDMNVYRRLEPKDFPWFLKGGTVRARRGTGPDEHMPVFPEELTGSDRIFEQLMYALPENRTFPTKKVLLPPPFRHDSFLYNETSLSDYCPVHQCAFTFDERARDVDAIVFWDNLDYNVTFKKPKNQIWIKYFPEPPPFSSNRSTQHINWTMSYRADSDLVAPRGRWLSYGGDRVRPEHPVNYARNKTKKVAWIVTNCNPTTNRFDYVSELSKFIKVDIYGEKCGYKRCGRGGCQALLGDYKFYLAFEDASCMDYISNKFFVDALQNDVLPVVMGPERTSYESFAPDKSYLHADDFQKPQYLAEYLNLLDENDSRYNEYFYWKIRGELVNTYLLCRMCALLHAADLEKRFKYHEDVNVWWHHNKCTYQSYHYISNLNLKRLYEEAKINTI